MYLSNQQRYKVYKNERTKELKNNLVQKTKMEAVRAGEQLIDQEEDKYVNLFGNVFNKLVEKNVEMVDGVDGTRESVITNTSFNLLVDSLKNRYFSGVIDKIKKMKPKTKEEKIIYKDLNDNKFVKEEINEVLSEYDEGKKDEKETVESISEVVSGGNEEVKKTLYILVDRVANEFNKEKNFNMSKAPSEATTEVLTEVGYIDDKINEIYNKKNRTDKEKNYLEFYEIMKEKGKRNELKQYETYTAKELKSLIKKEGY